MGGQNSLSRSAFCVILTHTQDVSAPSLAPYQEGAGGGGLFSARNGRGFCEIACQSSVPLLYTRKGAGVCTLAKHQHNRKAGEGTAVCPAYNRAKA